MSSAIELYKEAYDLDYNKGDSLYAEVLYKEIIERFPHSDEKEYAQVHLERIAKLKGNPDDPTFKPLRSGGGSGAGLAVVCFVLILFILTALGFGGSFIYRQYKRIQSNELIIHGLISEKNGNSDDAEKQYERARQLFPRNGVAYHCLADLYLRTGKTESAELVTQQWELMQPYDNAINEFKTRLVNPPAGDSIQ
ncbi:MAG: tetratricopeptide repeat protein [Chitinispirillaceae bacterium]|nr:tetratricopeptide repeat protein [Chitinispirillaceae bacterium]